MQSTKLPRNKGPQQTIHSLIHELHPAPSDPGCEFPSHENSNPTNFAITYLQLVTHYAPTIFQSPNITVFEDPNDNVAIFDLTQQIPRLVGNQTNLNVTFYLSELDAIANTNELIGVTSYTNISNYIDSNPQKWFEDKFYVKH